MYVRRNVSCEKVVVREEMMAVIKRLRAPLWPDGEHRCRCGVDAPFHSRFTHESRYVMVDRRLCEGDPHAAYHMNEVN